MQSSVFAPEQQAALAACDDKAARLVNETPTLFPLP
jgi:hypothetical protein